MQKPRMDCSATLFVSKINYQENVQAVKENREPHFLGAVYPHAIIHTFCSRCFENNMDPKVVQGLMGHQHYSTTMDIYTHVMESKLAQEAEKFGNAMMEENDNDEDS